MPTGKHLEVLRWVVMYVNQNGWAPTLEDIAAAFEWSGRTNAKNYLDEFRRRGWVTGNNGPRAWSVTTKGRRAAR